MRFLLIGITLVLLVATPGWVPAKTPAERPSRFQDSNNTTTWEDNFSGDNLSDNWSLYANGEAPSSDPWNWTVADGSIKIDSVGEMVAPIDGNMSKFTIIVDLNGTNYHMTFRIGEPGDPWNSTCSIGTWSGPEGDFRLWDNYSEQFISWGDDLSDNHTITIVGADTIIEVYVNDVHIGNGTCSRTTGRVGFGSTQHPNDVYLHHYDFHRDIIRPTPPPPKNYSSNDSGAGNNETEPANLTSPDEDNLEASDSTPVIGFLPLVVVLAVMAVLSPRRRSQFRPPKFRSCL